MHSVPSRHFRDDGELLKNSTSFLLCEATENDKEKRCVDLISSPSWTISTLKLHDNDFDFKHVSMRDDALNCMV